MAPKETYKCPICKVPYVAVRQHLIKYHHVTNKTELQLLLRYTSLVFRGRLNCPVCKMRNLVRLDKHLRNVHTNVEKEDQQLLMWKAKQLANLKALADLRRSDHQPAMISLLDVRSALVPSSGEEEEDGGSNDESENEAPQQMRKPSIPHTCQQCHQLRLKIRNLKLKLKKYLRGKNTQQRPSPPSSKRKKYEQQMNHPANLPAFEKVLNMWFQHISSDGKKQLDNAKQRVQHVRSWAYYMTDNQVPSMTLSFLERREKLIQWTHSLERLAVTSRRICIGNVGFFLKFLIDSQLPEVKAPRKYLQGALFTLQAEAKKTKQKHDLQTQKQEVRIHKSKLLVSSAHITTFLKKATKETPAALLELEKHPTPENLYRFYGLLAGFIICMTGHHRGVIRNMTLEEVCSAEIDNQERRIIRVKEHKTKETFGHALIPLTKSEFMWFYRFVYQRHEFPCGESELVFANSNGGACNDILKHFQECWKEFGLPGNPTFQLIRSSISTIVSRSLATQKTANIRRMMCYSGATTEKFYVVDLNFNEAFQSRNDTEEAMSKNAKQYCTLSEDDVEDRGTEGTTKVNVAGQKRGRPHSENDSDEEMLVRKRKWCRLRRHLTDSDSDLEGEENDRGKGPAPEPNVIDLTTSTITYDMDLDRIVITIDANESDHSTQTDGTADKDGNVTAEDTTKGDHMTQTDGTADKGGDATAEDMTEGDHVTQTDGTADKDWDATAEDATKGDQATQSDGTADKDWDATAEDATEGDQVTQTDGTADKDRDVKTEAATGTAY